MYLKRVYGDEKDPKKVTGVKVLRAGPKQNFAPELIQKLVSTGAASMGAGKIVLHSEDGDVSYTIDKGPGYYCCHCGEEIIDAGALVEEGVTVGMQHVKEKHADAKSPDTSNPSGYRKINHFECAKAEGGK